MTQGRIIQIEGDLILIRSQKGIEKVRLDSPDALLQRGDLVKVENGQATCLTPNLSASRSTRFMDQILDPRRIRGVTRRAQVLRLIREFFHGQAFLETETPLLVPCPGMETHIRPYRVQAVTGDLFFLPTSPEFAMKRLLVGGLEKIFQLSRAFRNEPVSSTHQPEFTMLEWYRAFSHYEQIMRDTEELFAFIALHLFGSSVITYQNQKIDLTPPWPRLKVRDLFLNLAEVNLVEAHSSELLAWHCQRLGIYAAVTEPWDDLYFKIWLNCIEPQLPKDRAVFVTRYPASQSALAVKDRDTDGSLWAKRFEVYAGNLELGNAFEELTDPAEQRARFVADMDQREKIYGAEFPRNALDEDFLAALDEGLPPSGGIAVGVDRLVMLFADEPEIQFTQWLPHA